MLLLRHRDNPLIRQAFSYGLGTTLYKFHVVLLVPLFAYAFDAAEAGRMEIALFGAGLVSAVASANLNTVVSQRYTQSARDQRPLALGLGVVAALVVAAIGLVVAAILSVWFVAEVPELNGRASLAIIALGGAVLNALVGNLCVFFQLKSAPRAFNVTYTTWSVIVLFGTVAYVLGVSRRADSFVIATLAAGIVCTGMALVRFKDEIGEVRHDPDARRTIRTTLRVDLVRAGRLFPVAIMAWALLFVDRKLLSAATDLDEVGIYGLAVRIANGITLVLGPLQAAWWDASMNQEPDDASVTLRRSIRAHAVALFVCVCGAIVIAQGPFPDLLGDWFGPGVRYIPVLVVCATLISTYVLPTALLTRRGNYRAIIGAYATAVAVNITVNLALDTRYGAVGASLANLSAYVCLNAVAIWPVRHEFARSLGPARRSVAALAIGGTAMALCALFFPSTVLTGY